MIIVSEDGAKAMKFVEEFSTYAAEMGVRDPFAISMKLFSEKCIKNEDGSISYNPGSRDPREPTRAEKDAYIKKRNEYVARRCFYEIGYDMFLAHTKPEDAYDISYMRDLDEFVPCRSADRQCAMFCKNIGGNCNEENL